MVYNPATDFLGLWRNNAGQVSKVEMPGLDYLISALARAGVVTVTVGAAAPVANQSITAWLRAAVPSYSAEGAFFLWDKVTTAYLAATPALFQQFLEACANESGISWWTTAGGAPLNTVGNNGDYALRTDGVGGIYGPKVAGAWPATPLPGTTNTIDSTTLDNTFGAVEGSMLVRGAATWQALAVGAANTVLKSNGVDPGWQGLSALLDAVFGNAQGSLLYRDLTLWQVLAPGATNQVLATGGAGGNPSWAPRTAEFPAGTVMLFQQTAAPPGWTKQVAVNDYGLRVTSGVAGITPGTAFSTVFAQTAVGNTTLSTPQMPSHGHGVTGGLYGGSGQYNNFGNFDGLPAPIGNPLISISNTGGGGAHTHSVNLTLSYIDVIIASKN